MKTEIERITLAVSYIAFHLYEYANDTKLLRDKLQQYIDEALDLVHENKATREEVSKVYDLSMAICNIINIDI